MAIAPTIGVPAVIESGNYVSFLLTLTDYPASQWAGSLVISQGSAAPVATTADASGDAFLVTPTTTGLPIGLCEWAFYVTQSAHRLTADNGTLTVLPNLAATAQPSKAQAMLTALETAITQLSGGKNQSVEFNGQSCTKRDVTQLLKQRVQLQAEVLREQAALARARGGADPARIAIQFIRP